MPRLIARLSLAVLLIMSVIAPAQAEAPRERINIDRDWRFALGDPADPRRDFGFGTGAFVFAKAGYGDGPASPKFDDRAWRKLDLPHDWAVELPFDQRGDGNHGHRAIGIGFPDHNIGWYRKTLAIRASDRGRRIAVEFDGVYRDAAVWFNGFYIGREPSGYSSVSYDLTDYVNYDGPNVLVVRVDAAAQEGWFYEGAGIYRHVWLTMTDPLHVGHWGSYVTTEVGADAATVSVRTTIDNDGDASRHFTIAQEIADPAGRIVATASAPGDVAPRSSGESSATLTVPNPLLWSIETPALHRLVTTIRDGDRIVDRYETPFGIRTIRFDPDTGFWLNGRNIKLKGANNHQDHAGIGVALPDALQAYRLRRLKAFGANAYRASHNPPTPELLDAADRLGMLIIDEQRVMGTTPEIRDQLRRMVIRDRNHPSVILWSVGNEEWAIEGNSRGSILTKEMQAEVARLDPSRRAVVAMSSGAGRGSSTTTDIMGFNYRSQHDTDAYHRAFPNTPALMTEEGSTFATRGVYVTDPANVSIAAYDMPQRPEGSSSIQQGWQAVAERPWMAGMFVWTGFDYGGETTPLGWPAVSSQFGMLDTTGAFKDSAWYLKSQWTGGPFVHLLPHWNWPDRAGQPIPVWVYSNAHEVELFLNGRSLGRKVMPRYGHLEWQVPYEPGRLVAKGVAANGAPVRDTVETTGEARRIMAVADRSTIAADGTDVAVVTLSALDSKGRSVPTADDEIELAIDGPGRIIGVGNGNPGSHDGVRPADIAVPSATTGWALADADAARTNAGATIDLAGLTWRDPFAYYPPGTGPRPTDSFALRGAMMLAGAPGTDRTLFLPDLTPGQAVFIDGKDATTKVRKDASGPSLPLDGLAPGAHQIVILIRSDGVAALRRLQDRGLAGTNVAWLGSRIPAAPWRVRLFNGLAQVLVQSSGGPGNIMLAGVAPGRSPARLRLATSP